MGTFSAISVNNILNAVWLYCLILEPRFSRGVTAALVAVWFAGIEAFSFATLSWTQSAPFPLFALGFCVTVAYHLGACVLLSSVGLLKVAFLYMVFFQNTWTFVFILQNILGRDPLTWNLVGVGLNIAILIPFELYLKRYYLRVCQEIESGYGIVTGVAALEFLIMSVILLYTPYKPNFNAQEIIFLLSLLTLAAVVHFLLFRLLAQMNQQRRIEHMELQKKILLSQIEAYEQMERETARRRHDARHHILVLSELIRDGEREKALEYLKQQEAQPQGSEQRFCENRMVNTIVSAYARKARQAGIELKTDIIMGPRSGISDMDFVAILANVLENAIHACQEVRGQTIQLRVSRKGRKLAVVCVNPCRRDIAFKEGLPVVTSPGGIGIKSVLHAAGKYGGNTDFSLVLPEEGVANGEGPMFRCTVILNDPI